jgi:nucleoside-diphosphate-sugar epimerase
MTRRLLLTGATGFVGRHTIRPLVARGFEVHALSSAPHAGAENGVEWHRGSLLASGDVEALLDKVRPTHLMHLAWYVAPGKWADAPQNYEWAQASLNLLRGFADRGGKRAVVSGSCLEYDWAAGYCSESRTPRGPHTFYGTCKNAVQELWAGYAARAGVSSAWARIFFVYGPGEHPDRLVAHVIRKLLAGDEARCSHGRQIRDYLYVQDVADALVALAGSDLEGPINVASGQPIALSDLVARAAAAVGRPELVRLGAIPPAPSDAPLVVADVERLRASLGFVPTTDLTRGLAETVAWWAARQLETQAL